ncbi:DUF2059 domain-containing protein [Portibacter marinus]|uniref:DUF2059 domain-containing protein n=1 Tax=Portibacter marinus TaxID=2898660 RepID=UPI001F29B645|nr:DUF2059 domain-containing protein [Portibacter marinus]
MSQSPVQKTSKEKKIDELVEILGSEEQYQAFINVGLDNLIKKYGDNLTDSNIKLMREESLDLVHRFLENDLKVIYAKYLTENEIQDLIDFYGSETGKRFRQMQPLITQEINQLMMTKYMEEFKVNIAEKLRQN